MEEAKLEEKLLTLDVGGAEQVVWLSTNTIMDENINAVSQGMPFSELCQYIMQRAIIKLILSQYAHLELQMSKWNSSWDVGRRVKSLLYSGLNFDVVLIPVY